MKKLFYSLALLLIGAPAVFARQLTPDEALANASGFMTKGLHKAPALNKVSKFSLVKTMRSQGGDPTVYIFSGKDGKGLLIAPAESQCPAVLGYADEGTFDVNNMPPAMEGWLDNYSQEIQMLAEGKVVERPHKAAAEFTPIEPITKTLWNQSSPYNDLTPTIDGKHTVTGCVATAMAQAMKVIGWPAQAQGTCKAQCNNQTLTLDLSETTLNWSDMLDSYTDGGTDAQKDAVAQLMRACGYSVNMNYTLNESGAAASMVPIALINNFNYDKATRSLEREYYYLNDWEEIIYNELKEGRPVIYSGVSPAKGGHCFVCDGYSSDRYFHINWGWGGMSNGYFRLSALTPAMQGIGGSTGGFNTDQSITIGLRKPQPDSEYFISVVCSGSFMAPGSQVSTSGVINYTSPAFINRSACTLSGSLGVKLVNTETSEVTYISSTRTISLQPNYYTTTISTFGTDYPKSGSYVVTPAFYDTEAKTWYDVPVSLDSNQSLQLTCEDGVLYFTSTPLDAAISVNNVTLNSAMYSNAKFKVTATVNNTGDVEYLGNVTGVLIDADSNLIAQAENAPVDVLPGESQELDYISQFTQAPAAGVYYFVFVNTSGDVISEPVEVDITAAPAGAATLGARNFVFPTGDGLNPPTVPYDNIVVEGELLCRSGYYAGGVTGFIFPARGGSSLATLGNFSCFLNVGETQNFKLTGAFPAGTIGTRYMIALFAGNTEIPGYTIFKLGEHDSGIVSVENEALKAEVKDNILTISGTDGISSITIYTLGGSPILNSVNNNVNISELEPGYYIALISTEAGNQILKFLR